MISDCYMSTVFASAFRYGLSEQRDMIEQALELNGADLKARIVV